MNELLRAYVRGWIMGAGCVLSGVGILSPSIPATVVGNVLFGVGVFFLRPRTKHEVTP